MSKFEGSEQPKSNLESSGAKEKPKSSEKDLEAKLEMKEKENLWFLVSWFKPADWYARQRGERGKRGFISRNGDFTEERKDAERWQDHEEAEGMKATFVESNLKEEFKLVELEDSGKLAYDEAMARFAEKRGALVKAHQDLADFLPNKDHIWYQTVVGDKKEEVVLARRIVRDAISSVNFQLERRQKDGFALELKPEVANADEVDATGHVSVEGVGWVGAENDWHHS